MFREAAAAQDVETDYGAKFLFFRTIRIAVPLCLYSITSFMYYPVFQSFVYQKVCEQYGDEIGEGINCTDRKSASSNPQLQEKANWALLLSSIAMCSLGVFSSALVGRFGDTTSRKAALLIPFIGLILEDISLFAQSYFMHVSVYWTVGSEAIFALFGGYMTIFSSSFAYTSDSVSSYPAKCRSQIIAILEGIIGLGGTIGYACSFLLNIYGYNIVFLAFFVAHVICALAVLLLPPLNKGCTTRTHDKDLFGVQLIKSVREQKETASFLGLIMAFAISFFTFIGSTHISFYYLKYRFGWDAALYGFVKGPTQGLATLNALFVYPFLRAHGLSDRVLTLIGLISRGLGRLWLAVAWSTPSVFLLILFDSFSRFAASGMRAIMAGNIPSANHGSMFALFAVTEAVCSLVASVTFHTLFPMSLYFLPQISFYILAAVMVIPVALLWLQHKPSASSEVLVASDSETGVTDAAATATGPLNRRPL